MANPITDWIRELENVIKPFKNMVTAVSGVTKNIYDATKAVRFYGNESKDALDKAKKKYAELDAELNDVRKQLQDLAVISKNAINPKAAAKAKNEYDQTLGKIIKLRKAYKRTKLEVEDLTEKSKGYTKQQDKLEGIAKGITKSADMVKKASDGLQFSVDVATQTAEIERMTDLTGESLDTFVSNVRRAAKAHNVDAMDMAKAASTMTKQMGGSYESNLDLIEQGIRGGANLNEDFLDQLRESGPAIKELGLSQAQAIGIMAKAGKEGIYSENAITSLHKASAALENMDKTQQDALKGVGIDPETLVGKTPIDAIQYISQAMQDKSPELRHQILSDIFKGAGEESGIQFIESLGTQIPDITKMKQVESAGEGVKGFFSDITTWAGQAFGDVGIYAQEIAPVFEALSGGIPLIKMLSKVTWLQTAAQWAFNTAMNANPLGVTIAIILAVVSAVMSFRRHWDSIVEAFKEGGIVKGLKRIGLVLLDALLQPVQMLLGLLAKIPGLGHLAGKGENYIKELREGLELTEDEKKDEKKTETVEEPKAEEEIKSNSISLNSHLAENKDLGGLKDDKKNSGAGLAIAGSGSNAGRSINMTLNITNNFSVDNKLKLRDIADRITGMINDRLRDSVVTLG